MNFDWITNAKMATWWLDFEDLQWPNRELTKKWEERAKIFVKNRINTVVLFGFHFRWDYVSILNRIFGVLSEISKICHDYGLKVVEHHSATLIHRPRNMIQRQFIHDKLFRHTPFFPDNCNDTCFDGLYINDFRQISAQNGKPAFYEGYVCEMFCPNNPNYQNAYKKLVEMHIEAFEVEGFMSDDLHFLPDEYSCGCHHCRQRFYAETGITLPAADDKNFWFNYENEGFQKWIACRYEWNADFYKRLRNILPEKIALWGCASDCVTSRLPSIGFSPQMYSEYWDAVFYEIWHALDIHQDYERIVTELIGFSTIAKRLKKTLIAIFYCRKIEDMPIWLDLLARENVVPWVCKNVVDKDAVMEEKLVHMMNEYKTKAHKPRAAVGVYYSESYRDLLTPSNREKYVKRFRELCLNFYNKENEVFVIFDRYRKGLNENKFDQLWGIEVDSNKALTKQLK